MTAAAPSRTLTAIDAEALRTRSRADFVYDSLRDAIWDGRITVGERIREEEIARHLGVSRTPVREALQRLHQRGLLVFGAGRGLTVASLSQHQVLQLYAMRESLEGSAARFAAEHATAPEIALLWRLQKELCNAGHDAMTLVTLNRRLHQAIYEAAHNQYLLQTLGVLHDSLALLHSITFRAPNRRPESDEEHRQIVEAIEQRKPDRAEEVAREHIRQAQRTRFENAAVGM
jgi:DNA-binding GntR family transcriptional regulator